MAREITGVGTLQDDGRTRVQMLYVFPISPRVVDGDGVDIVPYDTNSIPQHLESQLSVGQLAAISAGDAGYLTTQLDKSAGETDAQFVARVRVDYDGITAHELQERRDRAVEANDFDRRRFQVSR